MRIYHLDANGNDVNPSPINPLPIQTISNTLSAVTTLQNAAPAIGVGTILSTSGQGVASIAISGTFVATITFEGLAADGIWYAINVRQRGAGTVSSTATSTGLFEINVLGLTAIRANITSYTSGTITVKGQTQPLTPTSDTVQIAGRKTLTIQTHNAVSVLASNVSTSAQYIDCNGYDTVGVTLLNDASTASFLNLYWSNDNVTVHGADQVLASASGSTSRAVSATVKARYLKVNVGNGDTAAHTMSVWVYLKS